MIACPSSFSECKLRVCAYQQDVSAQRYHFEEETVYFSDSWIQNVLVKIILYAVVTVTPDGDVHRKHGQT